MELFNQEQYQPLIQNGSDPDKDYPPMAHLFLPVSRCEWLLSEIDPQQPNIAFGLCDLGMGFPELGYVDLDELQNLRSEYWGCNPVMANPLFEGKYPMSIYAAAAKICDAITRKNALLKKLYAIDLLNKKAQS